VRTRFVTLAIAVVLVHLAANLAHGWAHLTIPVPNTPAQRAEGVHAGELTSRAPGR
jgi:hypothetical protein